uniref:Sulfate ABC transporter ATP-binding subunit n=1 Tax=Boodleopsis sp. FL1161 TaxID=2364084 RepID=A0A386AZA2_9CHLO|nr:Sulfate ABC transporter ATP-binding subunit [Boodleopsis sp. FL1161]
MNILIENVSKNYEGFFSLSNINLEIITGKLVTLIGPSGSGKSTLLRLIAGFEKPDYGRIWLNGKNSNFLPIQNRKISFVFQDYTLFPKMTIFENIAFGLKIKKKPLKLINSKVNELLHIIQLEKLSTFYPHQLSGGQKQRVAFARAIAPEPKILLLDEPFSALDLKTRKNFQNWLQNIQTKIPVTTLLVTHDLQEAMKISDEIAFFRKGRIEQFGDPKEIYNYPATNFIKTFLNFNF